MPEINYIRHLNAVCLQFSKDTRLNPTHISLYVALFQLWNMNRFPDIFYVNRSEVMNISKIGSKTTYHRCIKELSHFKYIVYFPSHNPFKGSQIRMSIFGTSSKQLLDSYSPISGQALVSYINNNKQIENINKRGHPKDENEVIIFFKKEKCSKIEAQKFYNHYQSNGWKLGGKSVIVDWHAAAKKWMLKAEEIKTSKRVSKNDQTEFPVDQNMDNLKTTKDKNYHEPL